MNYTEKDLPTKIHHGEMVTLADGTTVRFESNGEAKDIMLNDDWSPAVTLFPATDFIVNTSQGDYKLTATFEDSLEVSKI